MRLFSSIEKIALSLLSLSLTFILFEYALTAVGYQKRSVWWLWATQEERGSIFILDTRKIYTPRADNRGVLDNVPFTTDQFGNRTSYCPESPDTTVVFAGDSFTWGQGVEDDEAYPYYYGSLGKNTCTVNLGVPGYGISQEYITLIDALDKFHPDVVIWDLNTTDFFDDNINGVVKVYNRKPVIRGALMNGVYLQGIMAKYVNKNLQNTNVFNVISYSLQAYRCIRCDDKYDYVHALVSDIINRTKQRNIRFFLVITPRREARFSNGGQDIVYGTQPEDSMIRFIKRSFSSYIIDTQEGFTYMNNRPNDDILGVSSEQAFLDDGHLSSAGNRMMADMVFQQTGNSN